MPTEYGLCQFLSVFLSDNNDCFIKISYLCVMQAQVEIEFDQLVRLAKGLPGQQWTKLKND